jgi:hypothetical protein
MIWEQAILQLIESTFPGLPVGSWTFPAFPAIPTSKTASAMQIYPTAHDAQDISVISDIKQQRAARHHHLCS